MPAAGVVKTPIETASGGAFAATEQDARMNRNDARGRTRRRLAVAVSCLMIGGGLAACDKNNPGWENPYDPKNYGKRETVFGEGGLTLWGDDKAAPEEQGGGLGVNGYLWRASLDTLSFMPITSADPFGGVILTDWHTPQEAPNERFKLQVYILSRALRADGVRVAVFRQVRVGADWRDSAVPQQTATDMENAILLRARQMRRATVQSGGG